MARSPVVTRVALSADIPVLAALWSELRHVGARAERAVNPVAILDISERLFEAMSRDDCRVLIADTGGEPAGMAVLREARPDPLSTHRVVHVSHLVVAPGKRRRGVGHSLLAAAADYADELQVEHVAAGVYPSMRDASRFYARLGFAQVLVQRVAPVSVLRRRLGAGSEMAGGRMDDVLRRRSKIRRPVPAQRAARLRPGDRVD